MIQHEKNGRDLAVKEWEASLDSLPQLILMLDPGGAIIRGNLAVETWGLGKWSEIKGFHFHRLFHPNCDDVDCRLNQTWPLALDALRAGHSLEERWADEYLNRHLKVHFYPVLYRDGYPPPESNMTTVAVFEDITREERLEEKIRRAASDLHGVFDQLPDRYIRVDRLGAILSYKPGAADDDFFISAGCVGRNIREFLPDAFRDRFISVMENALASRSLKSLEYTVSSPRNERIYEGRFIPIFNNQVDIINRDITETKKFRSIAESVDMMKNLGYIFSGIRHEIGNPVNSIKMTVSVLKNNLDHFSRERVLEYLERVFTELGRVEYLLKNFKTFNMFEELNPGDVNLRDFMEKLIHLLENDFQGRGIRLTFEVAPDAERVRTDSRALHQVMLNIIGNAAEALENVSEPAIAIQVSKNGQRILVQVRDNGPGIREDILPDVFRPFFTTKTHGAGLGLSIVQKILSKMGGSIRLNSRIGEGVSALMEIPEDASEVK